MSGAKTAKRPLAAGSRAKRVRRRYAHVMKPEYLAEIERMRLMDDDFMSKCLENAPECIELMLQIILGKKDLKVIKSQTEYPIKKRVGDFKQTEEGRRTMCEAFERIRDRGKAEGEARGERKNMLATAKRLLANGKLVLKEIAQCTGLSLAQVKKLQASMA